MDLGLHGSVALVTGGSRGIGRDIALGLARENARVAICARSEESLDRTAKEIRELGGMCLVVAADLLDHADCQAAVDRTADYFGRFDTLVNNASASVDNIPRSIADATDDQLAARWIGKTMPAIRCARAALPHMKRAGGGSIINVGGTSARSVFRGDELPMTGSGLSQGLGNAALCNFSKYLAEEVAADNISVNVVHPHLTRTERHAQRVEARARQRGLSIGDAEASLASDIPLGRLLEPSDITPIVLFLASPLARAITGQAIAVDGGALRMIGY
jgi:3-oxoacyl-[acyl-carrier protein] reductase